MLVQIIGPNGAPALVTVDVRGGTAGMDLRTFARRVEDGTYTVVEIPELADDELDALEAAGYANEVDLDEDGYVMLDVVAVTDADGETTVVTPSGDPEPDVATTDNEPAVDAEGFAVTELGTPEPEREPDTPPAAPKRRGRPPKQKPTE
jgi:hypothetical protein